MHHLKHSRVGNSWQCHNCQPDRASKGGDARQHNKGVLAEAFLLEEIYDMKLDPGWQKLFLLQLG